MNFEDQPGALQHCRHQGFVSTSVVRLSISLEVKRPMYVDGCDGSRKGVRKQGSIMI